MKVKRFNENKGFITSIGQYIRNSSKYFEILVGFNIPYVWDCDDNETIKYMCNFDKIDKIDKLKKFLDDENISYKQSYDETNIEFFIPIKKVIEYSQLWLDAKNFNL